MLFNCSATSAEKAVNWNLVCASPFFVMHPAEKLELSQSSYAELRSLIGSREEREGLVDRLHGILAYRLHQMGSNAFMLGTESIMECVGVFARLYLMGSSMQSSPPRLPSAHPFSPSFLFHY